MLSDPNIESEREAIKNKESEQRKIPKVIGARNVFQKSINEEEEKKETLMIHEPSCSELGEQSNQQDLKSYRENTELLNTG
jgi:hypothetical protein